MSESGGSLPQDDSDEDIYNDFSDFNFGDELAKLEQSKEKIKKEALDLSEQVKSLTKENEGLRKSNEILKKNMSSLLKTAQAEIQRKDSMIEELRKEIDSYTFRRKNIITKDTFTSTQDLEMTVPMKNGCKESRSACDKKRSKSKDCRSSSDTERKAYQEEKEKRESEEDRENPNCDNNRKYGYYRNFTRRKSRHSGGNREDYNVRENNFRKSTKTSKSDYRDAFSESHKSHSKYHKLDRRKRSRSSDRRFTYKGRSTRRRERTEDSQRRRDSGKRKSVSYERSRGSKESSLDLAKSRSSPSKDLDSRTKENSNKLKETNSVKTDSDESKKEKEPSEKERDKKVEEKTSVRAKRIPKEENPSKNEKPYESDKFSTKSPLDALYGEIMVSRTSGRFSKQGSGVSKPESEFVEGNTNKTDQYEDSHMEKEDWTLSFKNERRDTTRPMTLYSKRMMRKLLDEKKTESLNPEKKPETEGATAEDSKKSETEKEPGELTDDENVIESSKEFQELTKVASIESETIDNVKESDLFKEPKAKASSEVKNTPEVESGVEDALSSNEVQCEFRDVIEYSPFKNNYKLIEISPIKPPDKEHIKELYHKRTSSDQVQKEVQSSIFNLLSTLSGVSLSAKTETKDEHVNLENKCEDNVEQHETEKSDERIESKPKNRNSSKSKKSDNKKREKKEKPLKEENKGGKSDEMGAPGETTQFLDFFLLTTSPSKPIVPGQPETPGKTGNENFFDLQSDAVNSSSDKIEEKNSGEHSKKESSKTEDDKKKKTKKIESEKTVQKKQDKSKDTKKAKEISKKDGENKLDGKSTKRKRNSESEIETKKPKLDESPRKRTRSRQNSGSKTDKPKLDPNCPNQPEPETRVKEDITTFEFFKPIAKKDALDTPTECKMTAMSVANIVCLETPNKSVTNLKNLMINEQVILNVVDSKTSALCSPLMTPRRLLKNDLMLTDSEDESANKGNIDEEGDEMSSDSENSACESDSGASDFVDLL